MMNPRVLPDSNFIQQVTDIVGGLQTTSTLDSLCKIATVCIALINIILTFYIFLINTNKSDVNIEKNRKISLLKTLILDYNLKYLYDFFEHFMQESKKLKTDGLNDQQKTEINNKLLVYGSKLRQNFVDPFLAIDSKLYQNIINSIDSLLDNTTNNIFDAGINLSHEPKFKELITNKITETKTYIIKLLFNYSGN